MPVSSQASAQVHRFIQNLKQPQQQIVEVLRDLILASAPEIEERFTHKVPFYYRFGRVLSLNPKKESVQLGFCDGHVLADEHGLLSGHELKIVRHYEVGLASEIQL